MLRKAILSLSLSLSFSSYLIKALMSYVEACRCLRGEEYMMMSI